MVDLLLSIPVGSADCERGFNHMKLLKSDTRTRLTNASMNDQMAILMSGCDVEAFDPLPAVTLWNEAKMRRRRLGTEAEEEDASVEDYSLVDLEDGRNRLQEVMEKLAQVVVVAGLSKAPLPVGDEDIDDDNCSEK